MSLLSDIKERASKLGFDVCGVAPYRTMDEAAPARERWLGNGWHAGMKYMERYDDLRIDPAKLAEDTRSVVVCLISYQTDRNYAPGVPKIASYGRSVDYHYTVKEKLNLLLDHIRQIFPESRGRVFVDSAPVLEKNWAVEAGLGWTGRNSLLIHPDLGSFCFIGIILTSAGLDEYDQPYTKNHCGSCRRCIESCPTGAIQKDGLIDANRCFSYQTIENPDLIPEELIPLLGDRLFGCDTCQDACPWNVRPQPRHHPAFEPIDGIYEMSPSDWLEIDKTSFKLRFGKTPLARPGLRKIQQTILQGMYKKL